MLLLSCSVVSDSATPRTVARQVSLSFIVSWSLLKLMSIESVMPSYYLVLCHPLLLLPSVFRSIRVFSTESSLCISPSNEYSGLISLQSKGFSTLLQHHTSKASILWRSAFFTVQLSPPYMAPGKAIALTRWNNVGKVISLPFNMLSRLVIAFLPRSQCLLVSWLQSPSALIFEP